MRRRIRFGLWCAVGALLLLRAGTGVVTTSGTPVIAPGVFDGLFLVWLFVSVALTLRWMKTRLSTPHRK